MDKYISIAESGQRTGAGTVSTGQKLTMVNGNIAVTVPVGGDKTFYLWAEVQTFGSPGTFTGSILWENAFGQGFQERWFYATPMN